MMRAKLKVSNVEKWKFTNGQLDPKGITNSENIVFAAVCKSDGYPADGSDENNTFAKWTPTADLKMIINNPALFDKFNVGDEFYVDFTPIK